MIDDLSAFSLALPPWLQAILWVLLGSGGLAGVTAVAKAFNDRQQGISAHELAEDEAISQRWRAIVDTQVNALIEPLKAEIVALREEVLILKTELISSRAKYWKAISHIRSLHLWISRHMPEGIEPPPAAPDEVMEDV